MMSPSLQARIWAKVQKTETCWLWTGYTTGGYGRQWDGSRVRAAHRIIYELLIGPIPDGLDLDHLCRVRNCVNPTHVEPVTRSENVRRGRMSEVTSALQRNKTHCKYGHPYDEANTHRTRRGSRVCRTCHNRRSMAAYYAKKAQAAA